MAIWIAAGDETGSWDIVDGRFESDYTGLAWALGTTAAWDTALGKPLGATSVLDAFSQPIAKRLPAGFTLRENSSKYHLMDVWKSFPGQGRDIPLDQPQPEPALELVRQDAVWLLRDSGLGVLATGGNALDARAAGLGLSNDGSRERARAFAGLLTVALPFLPGGDSLNLIAEGRTEIALADILRTGLGRGTNQSRYDEPYRDFLGRLTEDTLRRADHCQSFITAGKVVDEIYCKGGTGLNTFLATLRGAPLLQSRSEDAVKAMKGIADLAATLAPRPDGCGFRLVVPEGCSPNLWSRNYRELRHAFQV